MKLICSMLSDASPRPHPEKVTRSLLRAPPLDEAFRMFDMIGTKEALT
jgi:hypothetical protein